jgi:hypothetical protein
MIVSWFSVLKSLTYSVSSDIDGSERHDRFVVLEEAQSDFNIGSWR